MARRRIPDLIRDKPPRRAVALIIALTLPACSTPTPPAVTAAPEPLPPVKQIIARERATLFRGESNPRNIRVGAVRRFEKPSGSDVGACLKASLTGATGKSLGTVTYVVTVERNQIADRRRAAPADECEADSYEPLPAN
jgi:hypothetical protein